MSFKYKRNFRVHNRENYNTLEKNLLARFAKTLIQTKARINNLNKNTNMCVSLEFLNI